MPSPAADPRPADRAPRASGFTLLELLVVMVVVGLLAWFLLGRVLIYQEAAERAAMEQTVGAFQSALTLQFSHAMVLGRGAEALAAENPVRWLAKPPENYAGEFRDPPSSQAARGRWHFDSGARELVYRVRFGEHFQAASGRKEARFRVRLVTSEPGGKVVGAVIEPAEPYEWQPG